jgi:polycomb group RING finger protein 1
MQDIVFKLVPGLYETEEKRKQEFFKARGLLKEQKEEESPAGPSTLSTVYDDPRAHYYCNDELLCICIERFSLTSAGCGSYQLPALTTKFVRCSVRTCVYHVMQLLRTKLNIPECYVLQIICANRLLDDWITLKQVWLSCWLTKPSPMMLFYRILPS